MLVFDFRSSSCVIIKRLTTTGDADESLKLRHLVVDRSGAGVRGDELIFGHLFRSRRHPLGQHVIAQEQRIHPGFEEALDGLFRLMNDRLAADVKTSVEHHGHTVIFSNSWISL